ncbi:hypothetical protein ACIA5C_27690 [Actinoplanes sp. NPDC051343]|uniref:hypothetical protein n=1 Tax=Actinoplanes sp. NPDC051343 TaxID=3363906 RepID=UPI0037A05C2A
MIQQLAQSPDIDAHYQIVDGWQKSADLVGEHMFQVQQYRESLATAWPPEKSSAAAAYITRLDALIKNLNETYEAALSNHEALSSASLSLGLAKSEMNKLYSQWDTNNKALVAFNQQQAQKKAQATSGQPTPTPSPSGDEPPPVTASQQEALRQKAITLMSGVSSDLAQAQLKVVRPAQYTPMSDVGRDTHNVGGGANNAPNLPPVVPTPFSGNGGGSTSGSSFSSNHGATTAFPTTPHNALPTTGSPFPSGNGNPGLVLGGTNTAPPPPPTLAPGPNPITTLPGGGGPAVNPGIMPPGTGPVLPNGTLPTGGNFPKGKGGFKPFGGAPEGGLKAMPPGGIIGKTPGVGLSEPIAGRLGPQRVNPVGGVIGGEPTTGPGMVGGRGVASGARGGATATGRGGMSAGGTQQPYGQLGGRRSGRRGQSEDMTWDPNNPWATDEGVDPVVLPPVEQRIDPGPAIGLS